MKPRIEWVGEPPTRPPAEQIENAVPAALAHPRDQTPLAKLVVLMRLEQDGLQRIVDGIGYSMDGKPLVTFHYSLVKPWDFWCEAPTAAP